MVRFLCHFLIVYVLCVIGAVCSQSIRIQACCSRPDDRTERDSYRRCASDAAIAADGGDYYPKIFSHRNRTILSEEIAKLLVDWHEVAVVSGESSSTNAIDNSYDGRVGSCSGAEKLSNNFLIIEDGTMWLIDSKKVVSGRDYCFDRGTGDVQICRRNAESPESSLLPPSSQPSPPSSSSASSSSSSDQNNAIQLRICCGFNGHFLQSNNYCEANVSSPSTKSNAITNAIRKPLGDFATGFPICSENITHFYFGALNEFRFDTIEPRTPNSFLYWPKFDINISLDHVCFEYFNSEVQVIACLENDYVEKNDPFVRNILFFLYPIGLYVGAFFLLVTLIVSYVLLPNTHHILHWKCQTNYVLFLFVGTIFLATNQLANSRLIHNRFLCTLIAVTMHFSFLSAFFWLNTMCFNIWWTFRDIRPNTLEKWQEKCRLRVYELYAWGIPFLITCTALVMDSMPDYPNFLRPKFCEKTCWFYGDASIVTYFFGPISILLTINLMLFFATAHELSCGLWKGEFVKSTSERLVGLFLNMPVSHTSSKQLQVTTLGQICLKLVVVMGVTWIFDVISWFANGPIQLWILTDFLNCLQGLFIFCVIGSQPHVWPVMKKKFSCFAHLLTLCCKPRNKHSEMIEETTTHNDPRHSFDIPEITTENVTLETMC